MTTADAPNPVPHSLRYPSARTDSHGQPCNGRVAVEARAGGVCIPLPLVSRSMAT